MNPGTILGRAKSSRGVLAASTVLRLGNALATLIILSMNLKSTALGLITISLAIGTLLSIVTDLGQSGFLLRRIGLSPATAWRSTERSAAVKSLVTAASMPFVAVLILLVPALRENAACAAMIIAGSIVAGFGDLFGQALRASRNYWLEFVSTAASFLISVAVVFLTVHLTTSLPAVGAAILFARIAGLGLVLLAGNPVIRLLHWRRSHLRRLGMTLNQAIPFSGEAIFVTITNQADIFLLSVFLTLADLGVYQAASRFNQAISPIAMILSVSHIAALAGASRRNAEQFSHEEGKMAREFWVAAFGAYLFFMLGGPLISHYLYRDKFPTIDVLWYGMAAASISRMMGATFAVSLSAVGRPGLLIFPRVLSLGCLAILMFAVVAKGGLASVPEALCWSSIALLWGNGLVYARFFGISRALVIRLAIPTVASIGAVYGLFGFSFR